jgi:photosystem II stability/assembly factor-like uncharacterized protein
VDELERAGRAVRDAVAREAEPNDRVRARARTIVRHRRMLAVGTIATAVIAASVGIGVAARGNGGLGVHTIAPGGSSGTRPPTTTVPTTAAAPRDNAGLGSMPQLAFGDALHGWRVNPLVEGGALEGTTDGGRTWTTQLRVSVGDNVNGVVAVDDHDAYAVVTYCCDNTRSQLLRTVDGARWSPTRAAGLGAPIALVSFIDRSHGWALTREGGLVATENAGDRWVALAEPASASPSVPLSMLESVCFTGSGSGWVASGSSVFRSDDDGATWRRQATIPVGGGLGVSLACNGPHVAYSSFDVGAGQHIGGFVRSDDGGAHWRPLTEDTVAGVTTLTAPGFPQNQLRGEPVAMAPDGTLTFTTGCYVCSPAQNWVVVASPTDHFVVGKFDKPNDRLVAAAVSEVDPLRVFAEIMRIGTSGPANSVTLYASSDGGHTWQVRWSSR